MRRSSTVDMRTCIVKSSERHATAVLRRTTIQSESERSVPCAHLRCCLSAPGERRPPVAGKVRRHGASIHAASTVVALGVLRLIRVTPRVPSCPAARVSFCPVRIDLRAPFGLYALPWQDVAWTSDP